MTNESMKNLFQNLIAMANNYVFLVSYPLLQVATADVSFPEKVELYKSSNFHS